VETLPVSIYRKDRQTRFTFVNRHFCETLNRDLYELLDRGEADFDAEDLAIKYTRDAAGVLTSGVAHEGVLKDVTPEGERRYIQTIQAPLRDAAGRITGLQGIFWDVSARERAEQELARNAADIDIARRIQQKLF